MALDFYTINENYLSDLRKIDNRIPNTDYDSNEKFFCGVVFTINGYQYFAPISSFKQKQATNILIYDSQGDVKGSIRFCFMIPVKPGLFNKIDFSKITDQKYLGLLVKELTFCRQNESKIEKVARRIYKIGTTPNHKLYSTCCDFKKLEAVLSSY